ncbi:MAG: hypothetical protein H6709_06445 [Kofleriaceae bacterium]|nr:hypothetical protein [Kofleriaceae bacterium]MCB9571714.1 hypothetical protein [Kofleriaceae bacterium]
MPTPLPDPDLDDLPAPAAAPGGDRAASAPAAPGALLDVVARRLAGDGLAVDRGSMGELVVHDTTWTWSVLVVDHRVGGDRNAVLIARICDELLVEPRDLLRHAAEMGAGAIALVGGSYVVRYAIPAALVADAPLSRSLIYVRDLAAALAAQLATGRPRAAADPAFDYGA